MGDGCLSRNSKHPFLVVSMITRDYLEYLDEVFGIHGTGVRHKLSPDEAVQQMKNSGFREEADPNNYHDVYRWNTRTHPQLSDFDWYTGDSGKKVWPNDIELTPTVLKHWYVGDGHWANDEHRSRLSIAVSNECGNEEKIRLLFDRSDLPTPNTFRTSERKDGSRKMDIRFTRSDTKTLFDYMGEPLPGFGYKFPM
jgi:hypothetical protein